MTTIATATLGFESDHLVPCEGNVKKLAETGDANFRCVDGTIPAYAHRGPGNCFACKGEGVVPFYKTTAAKAWKRDYKAALRLQEAVVATEEPSAAPKVRKSSKRATPAAQATPAASVNVAPIVQEVMAELSPEQKAREALAALGYQLPEGVTLEPVAPAIDVEATKALIAEAYDIAREFERQAYAARKVAKEQEALLAA